MEARLLQVKRAVSKAFCLRAIGLLHLTLVGMAACNAECREKTRSESCGDGGVKAHARFAKICKTILDNGRASLQMLLKVNNAEKSTLILVLKINVCLQLELHCAS